MATELKSKVVSLEGLKATYDAAKSYVDNTYLKKADAENRYGSAIRQAKQVWEEYSGVGEKLGVHRFGKVIFIVGTITIEKRGSQLGNSDIYYLTKYPITAETQPANSSTVKFIACPAANISQNDTSVPKEAALYGSVSVDVANNNKIYMELYGNLEEGIEYSIQTMYLASPAA